MHNLNLFLLILFAIIQVGDVLATKDAFNHGGSEVMPVARFAFAKLGFWPATLAIKGFAFAVAIAVTVFVSNAWVFTGVLDIIGAIVLAKNIEATS